MFLLIGSSKLNIIDKKHMEKSHYTHWVKQIQYMLPYIFCELVVPRIVVTRKLSLELHWKHIIGLSSWNGFIQVRHCKDLFLFYNVVCLIISDESNEQVYYMQGVSQTLRIKLFCIHTFINYSYSVCHICYCYYSRFTCYLNDNSI